MKLSNSDVFNAARTFETLSKREWPIKTSYQIALLMKKLSSQMEIIENIRFGLIQKYGVKDEKNNGIVVPEGSENWAKFVNDFNEILRQEIEIDVEKVEIPEIVDGKAIQIEPVTLFLIDKFITIK